MGGYAGKRWKGEMLLALCHTVVSEFATLEAVGATTISLIFEQSNSVSMSRMLIGPRHTIPYPPSTLLSDTPANGTCSLVVCAVLLGERTWIAACCTSDES
jgi:hypothetical protein